MTTAKPRRSISRKLLILVLAAVGAAGIVGTGASLWQETRLYASAKRDELFRTARVFASVAAAATAAGDENAALDAMRAIGDIRGLNFAQIETRTGALLAIMGSATQLDSDLRLENEEAGLALLDLFTSRSVQVSVPVTHAGVTVGRFVLVGDISDLAGRLAEQLRTTALGASIALVIGLIVAGRMQRGITAPLMSLAGAMARIRRTHDYEAPVEATSDDEVGLLVDGFNAMLGEIRERDARIDAHLKGLEQQVADRTLDLREARDSAQSANAAKSEFLATMSHEIRTPMNGIMVMAELLAVGEMPARQRRYAEVIAKSGQGLLAIINDILDLSKIESGKMELEAVALDPVALADDVTSLFGERARSKGLDVAAYVDTATPRRIVGDPVRLNQVVTNLVNNALKFTEAGHVTLTIGPDPIEPAARLRFAVTDTGIGIPEDKIGSIFSAFSQADQSTTRKFGGTGLGLTICKQLVEAMGGEIVVTSRVGEGSTFAFSIPVEAEAQSRAWPQAASVAGAPRPRALVAVEGEATARALALYFEAAGYAVERVPAGESVGADTLGGAAILLCDPACAKALPRRATEGGPVVLCFAPLGESGIDELVPQRAHGILARPVMRAEIERAIERVAQGLAPVDARTVAASSLGDLPLFEGLRVLVADDSAVNLEVAREAMMRMHVGIDTVVNGRLAVEAVAAGSFDLVLMDGSMPEMDGYEATRRIRAAEATQGRPRLPVVALTAHVVGSGADAWREAGMDAVVHKPFTIRVLADCIARLLPEAVTGRGGADQAPVPIEAAAVAPAVTVADDAADNPLLDPEMMQQLEDMASAGRGDFVQRVFGLYLEHGPKACAEIVRTASEGDLESIGGAAHALKSMSLNIGATRVARAAAEIERRTRDEGKPVEAGAVKAVTEALAETLAAVRARLGGDPAAAPAPSPAAQPSVAARPATAAPPEDPALAERRALARDLSQATTDGSLRTVYQPLMDRAGRATISVESLVRWQRPGHGPVSPALFIPVAEETGDIVAIGEWVMRQACRDGLAWPGLQVAVNVSPVQFGRPGFADMVEGILEETGFDPRRLELELTETAFMTSEDAVTSAMERLRARGVHFSLDDFGTGYSSLTYLRKFPFDKIKIDQSFVKSIETAVDAATIVHAVISIGRALGMKVVAEGVETPDQHRFLQAAGVHALQGYLFSKPLPAGEITERLTAERSSALDEARAQVAARG